jgi:DNA mismatch repair protein MutL
MIQILPDQLISQIAAGEVVERPASVVKELVENALDAGADSIHIATKAGGRQLIQVSDNGTGIPAEEARLALQRHATSKLRTVDDLDNILTLGFRGEALSSIASVSRMTLTTRHRDEQIGIEIRSEGGVIRANDPVGAPAGTVITVAHLFFNTPARLKFLKKETTEKRHITALVTRYAMAYPAVRFTLEQDGRELLRTTGSGELTDVLVKVIGLDGFKQMVPVELQNTGYRQQVPVTVAGFTSLPAFNRADRTQISIFVNGRWVNDSKLTYAVVQAYHALLDGGRYPVAVLMIELPPNEVDVNVHPAKAEVRFRDANAVFSVLQRAVREAVIASGERPRPTDYETGGAVDWRGERVFGQTSLDFQVEASGRLPRPTTEDEELDLSHIPEGAGAPVKPRTLPLLRVVGQVGATYIVAEGPAGLYLIDQHAAHQRVLYEDLLEQHDASAIPIYDLPNPQQIDFEATDYTRLENHLDVLTALGFGMEPFGTNTMQIRALPEILASTDLDAVLRDLTQTLRSSDTSRSALVRCIARLGAVKAGQVLPNEDLQAIVRRLERATEPLKDPAGHPTLLHMTGEQLAREFNR